MLTKKQNRLYWRDWQAAVKACRDRQLPEPDRHELHRQALGYDKSHLLLKNPELDKVLAAFRALSQPANLGAQLRQQDQPRTRLIWRIEHHALTEEYWMAVARDKFGTDDLDQLTEQQLEQLRNTLDDRLSQHRPRTQVERRAKNRTRRALATRQGPERRLPLDAPGTAGAEPARELTKENAPF